MLTEYSGLKVLGSVPDLVNFISHPESEFPYDPLPLPLLPSKAASILIQSSPVYCSPNSQHHVQSTQAVSVTQQISAEQMGLSS